jgi:hypothetical protein
MFEAQTCRLLTRENRERVAAWEARQAEERAAAERAAAVFEQDQREAMKRLARVNALSGRPPSEPMPTMTVPGGRRPNGWTTQGIILAPND